MKVIVLVSLLSLATFGCSATPAAESDDVRVEVESRGVDSLAVDENCYTLCMDQRSAAFPVDGTTSAQNPSGTNPDWANDAYKNADGCYAQCSRGGTGKTPLRKYKLKK